MGCVRLWADDGGNGRVGDSVHDHVAHVRRVPATGGTIMWEWEIIIEVWPYSTGQGADTDQQACGPRTHLQVIRADDFAIASKYANVAACALKSNPRVW